MPAEEAGANTKEVLSKKDAEELQALYLELAEAESAFHTILNNEDLINDPDGIKDAINSVSDQADKNALLDYYENSFEERTGNIHELKDFEELSEWMGCSGQRVGQIEDLALKKIRKNPLLLRSIGSGEEGFDSDNDSEFQYSETDRILYTKKEVEE